MFYRIAIYFLILLSLVFIYPAQAETITKVPAFNAIKILKILGSSDLLESPTGDCLKKGLSDGGIDHELQPGRWVLTLKLGNDNKFYGIWDYLIVGPENGGDDIGHTHGMELSLEKDLSNGIHLAFVHSNDLFTKPIPNAWFRLDSGIMYVPQYATEEKKFVLKADSRKKGRLFFWRLEGGAHILDGNPSQNLLLSSGEQQTQFHRLVNATLNLNFKDRVQRKDGLGVRYGILLGGKIGVQHRLFNIAEGKIQSDVYAESGATVSTHAGASSLDSEVGIRVRAKGPKFPLVGTSEVTAMASSKIKLSAFGISHRPTGELSVGTDRAKVGVEWFLNQGNLQNYQEYNSPNKMIGKNDDFANLFIRVSFGK